MVSLSLERGQAVRGVGLVEAAAGHRRLVGAGAAAGRHRAGPGSGVRAGIALAWFPPYIHSRIATFTARAGNRRTERLSALRAHTKAPLKMDFHRKTLRNAKGA